MHDVFISYAREDQVAAQSIASRLSRAGFSVFFDREGVVAGASWSNTIENELHDARAVLALLSSNSRRSTWVKDELQEALDNKKLVIPVLLDQGAKENWLWPLLATRHRIDLDLSSPSPEPQLEQLVRALSTALRKEDEAKPRFEHGLSDHRPAAPPAFPTVSSNARLWIMILVALVSAALGALATWLLWHF
jgi:TIR domain